MEPSDLIARLRSVGLVARDRFDTLENFTDLRIDPYLLSTARRVTDLRGRLEAEAARLASTRLALVHGDYSPKNLLVKPGRLSMLDAEAAWFGDPAFDAAFLLNHLFLKALFHAKLNQVGTVTEALRAIRRTQQAGRLPVISARSGETEDASIAHLAVATNAGRLKVGSFCRGERMAKWNEVLRIGRHLGSRARFDGARIFAQAGIRLPAPNA